MNAAPALKAAGAERRRAELPCLRQSFVVKLDHGLHARPCAALVKAMQPFRSSVEVEVNGQIASAHSILGLMALGAGCGSRMTFAIRGEDATWAMLAVRHLFETNFAEAHLTPV